MSREIAGHSPGSTPSGTTIRDRHGVTSESTLEANQFGVKREAVIQGVMSMIDRAVDTDVVTRERLWEKKQNVFFNARLRHDMIAFDGHDAVRCGRRVVEAVNNRRHGHGRPGCHQSTRVVNNPCRAPW